MPTTIDDPFTPEALEARARHSLQFADRLAAQADSGAFPDLARQEFITRETREYIRLGLDLFMAAQALRQQGKAGGS